MTWRDAAPGRGTVTAVVLAAGGGTRFRDIGHKLSAILPETADRPDESVATRSIAAAVAAEIGPVVVVTGRLSAADLGLPHRPVGETDEASNGSDIITVHNPSWKDGQMTSVRTGITAARSLESDVVVVGLADQPGIEPSAWRAVAAAASSDAPIAVAVYDGRRANPVALHSSVWDLLPTAGDEGARSLMRLHPDLVREVPCTGSPSDIDTAEDLRRWQNN
ncbi:nucleotidyltransferase family protein [Ilumatobacter nonamiensis]|uniref:nucleotidyltransferase family protein n=1 Tax=Ilumatobacter nonamiensis TaxID=467093 RepID=UPI0003463D7A|nr:NTP transferase domain-containing protein [Ilumatobacter nonamiensis]